jgi:phytoene/squalene synthetase
MDSDRELRGGDADFSLMPDMFPARLRPSVRAFGRFVRVADEITDSPLLSREEKASQLDAMEAVLDGDDGGELPEEARNVCVNARESLRETGVSPTHAHHILQAFRRDVPAAGSRAGTTSWSTASSRRRRSADTCLS